MLNKLRQFRNKKFTLHLFKKGEGFTLLELIVAIFVISIGVLAAYAVTQQIVSYTYLAASRFTATYLAKEGIEIVRNIRDTNWADNNPATDWNNGLGAGDYEAGYNDNALAACLSPCGFDQLNFLKLGAGFYNYSIGTDTNFKRKITIVPVGNSLEVSVEVWWRYKGIQERVTAQENLYNWY